MTAHCFETFQDLNIPTAKGRGWLASKLNKMTDRKMTNEGKKEIVTMVNEMATKPLPRLLRKPSQFNIPELAQIYKSQTSVTKGLASFVIEEVALTILQLSRWLCLLDTRTIYGMNVAQKWDGAMVYDVTDTGKKFGYGVRGSATSVELVFQDNAFGI